MLSICGFTVFFLNLVRFLCTFSFKKPIISSIIFILPLFPCLLISDFMWVFNLFWGRGNGWRLFFFFFFFLSGFQGTGNQALRE